jgi:hypothetical protein
MRMIKDSKKRGIRIIIYLVAAALLLLGAGCGWTSGEPFVGDYQPTEEYNPESINDPVAQVQNWFASMEFRRSPNEEGVMVPNPEEGRDFDLYLTVVDPEFLQDPDGMSIPEEELQELREYWNSTDWNIEFLEIVLVGPEDLAASARDATVVITSGKVRYIGEEMFGTKEYKEDNFGDKEGEIYLRWYPDDENDPLSNIQSFMNSDYSEIATKGRWVVVGGFDFGEEESWGETPQ